RCSLLDRHNLAEAMALTATALASFQDRCVNTDCTAATPPHCLLIAAARFADSTVCQALSVAKPVGDLRSVLVGVRQSCRLRYPLVFLGKHGIRDLVRARHQDLNIIFLEPIRHGDGTHQAVERGHCEPISDCQLLHNSTSLCCSKL